MQAGIWKEKVGIVKHVDANSCTEVHDATATTLISIVASPISRLLLYEAS